MPSNRVRIIYRLRVNPAPVDNPPDPPVATGISHRGNNPLGYWVLTLLVITIISLLAYAVSRNNNGSASNTVTVRPTPARSGATNQIVNQPPLSPPNTSGGTNRNPASPIISTATIKVNTPTPLPTSTNTPVPLPTSTPRPTKGTIRIELRHSDNSAMVDISGYIFHQELDINGKPILGGALPVTGTSGSSGAVIFNPEPGDYVVLLDLPGPRFKPQGGSRDFESWPGFANFRVVAGETTALSLTMGTVVSNLANASQSCLIVVNPDGTKYNAACKGFKEGVSRVEILPGTYRHSFTFGDSVQSYSDVGLITVSANQTIEKHCTATRGPYSKATCN